MKNILFCIVLLAVLIAIRQCQTLNPISKEGHRYIFVVDQYLHDPDCPKEKKP